MKSLRLPTTHMLGFGVICLDSNDSNLNSYVAKATGLAQLVQALRFNVPCFLDRFAESLGPAGAALQLHSCPRCLGLRVMGFRLLGLYFRD